MYLIGYDIGSSSIKVALANIKTGEKIGVVQKPDSEMPIHAPKPTWAEQDPEDWWQYACQATRQLLAQTEVTPDQIKAIGIAYQMHGLVAIDRAGAVIRPAIIWCDGRAVDVGDLAFEAIGPQYCLSRLLNSPGNFTASKLKWLQENEPEKYQQIHKVMLPGDFMAYKMTGLARTTVTGLSEGIFWDFRAHSISGELLNHFGISDALIPEIVENFVDQGRLQHDAAAQLGLDPGTPITYRAGDQPNNAMALNVLNPGEVAATGGTSGVVYAIVDGATYDSKSRVNGFAHVNHKRDQARIGILLCINGAGIQYGWIKNNIAPKGLSYTDLEKEAQKVGVGSDGLVITSFGNGPERIFENRNLGAHVHALDFNRHGRAHLYRATLEGIAFAFVYGIEIMQEMGLVLEVIRVGNDNLFLSDIFSQTIANLTGAKIEMLDSTGAVGAALAAGVGVGAYHSIEEAQAKTKIIKNVTPDDDIAAYKHAYERWKEMLQNLLSSDG